MLTLIVLIVKLSSQMTTIGYGSLQYVTLPISLPQQWIGSHVFVNSGIGSGSKQIAFLNSWLVYIQGCFQVGFTEWKLFFFYSSWKYCRQWQQLRIGILVFRHRTSDKLSAELMAIYFTDANIRLLASGDQIIDTWTDCNISCY